MLTFKISATDSKNDFQSGEREQKVEGEGKYTADHRSLIYDEKRILPVMGEFHYSRWEDDTWEEELRKMKSGGIQIVATYIFWIHHEEKENEWNFSGRRDIRKFVQTCQKVGLQVFLRIGPWVHAEVRNGGLPDWVQHSGTYEVRTNAEGYLRAVKKYFDMIGKQLDGLMYRDGGPVIGVQLENEYGHVGGPKDAKIRYEHMKTLYLLAQKAGFIVPYYTATGWGDDEGHIEETMPVLGGYVDAPWYTTTEPMPASSNFLFIPYRNDESIGTGRFQEKGEDNGKLRQYPFLTAELGTGLQVTSHRRPWASASDIESNVVCMLGSGANLLGYYMYHGGINPDGQYTTLNEEQRIGGYTTLPIKSYDFEAPINECGRINDSYGAIRKWNLLVQDFGEEMAQMEVFLPEEHPESAEDVDTIRASVRFDQGSGTGYLFINNHQRLRTMKRHEKDVVRILWKERRYEIPIEEIREDAVYVYRFILDENGDAEKTPGNVLCRLGNFMVVYGDIEPKRDSLNRKDYIYLDRKTADRAARFSDGIYITERKDSVITDWGDHKELLMFAEEENVTILYENGEVVQKKFQTRPTFANVEYQETVIATAPDGKLLYREYLISVNMAYDKPSIHNLYLHVEYDGDRAEIYEDGKLLDDWYTTGAEWNVNMKRFGYPKEFTLRIYDSSNTIPCTFGRKVYYDLPVKAGCELKRISVKTEYRIIF